MNNRQILLLRALKEKAIKLDWEVAFGGKAFGNRHLFRVNKIAKFLNEKEGGDIFITLAGAWIHDVSLAWGSDYNPTSVKKHTLKFLQGFSKLTEKERRGILLCAIAHEGVSARIPIEAKIVHDADIIDKSGLLGVIRHVWKMTNMLDKKVLSTKRDLQKLQKHLKQRQQCLFTKTGHKLSQNLNNQTDSFFKNEDTAISFMNDISLKASKSWTSDKIAQSLLKSYKLKIIKNLESQLKCTYLSTKIKAY